MVKRERRRNEKEGKTQKEKFEKKEGTNKKIENE